MERSASPVMAEHDRHVAAVPEYRVVRAQGGPWWTTLEP